MTDSIENMHKIACHEAGHAVVAHRLNLALGATSILPEGNALGLSFSESEWADGTKDRDQIIVLYAGHYAEKKFDPGADPQGSADDDQKAAELS